MTIIELFPIVGNFAENKDLARKIRIEQILPMLEENQNVVLDFSGVNGATQSFIHALISDLFRSDDFDVLDLVSFKGCNETVKKIINIVVDYMQESI